MWRWRFRKRGPGRPFSYIYIQNLPKVREFVPRPFQNKEPIELSYPELEVLRLCDLEKFTQEEAAKIMKTSRGTVWRLLESAREKIAKALTEGRPILISSEGEIEEV